MPGPAQFLLQTPILLRRAASVDSLHCINYDSVENGWMNNTARERGIKVLQQMLGSEAAEQTRETWRALSPDFERYVIEFLSGEIWSRPGLERRVKSLVTIAALTAFGRPQGLELNIRMALRNGASREDITETLLQIAPYVGFPACWEGLSIAARVFAAEPNASPNESQDGNQT